MTPIPTLGLLAILWNVAASLSLGSANGPPPDRLAVASATIAAPAERQIGGCRASVERGRLFVFGDQRANVIEIAGTADGVQLTCDGARGTFSGLKEIVVEAGDGDDQTTEDNHNGLLGGIAINFFGQDGNDGHVVAFFAPFGTVASADVYGISRFDAGPGNDVLKIFGGALADRFEIVPGTEAGSVQVRGTDVATKTSLGNVTGSELEFLSVKGGAGDDQFDVARLLAMNLSLFGDEGDDLATESFDLNFEQINLSYINHYEGGSGKDKFDLLGARAAEHYGVSGALNQEVPDPHIRVTNLATGLVIGDFFVQHTEEIGIATGAGDDRLDIGWDATGMSGLTKFLADLGDGHDVLNVAALPVRVAPATGGVQTSGLEIQGGRGDDQVMFAHSAGSWFDIAVGADLGAGEDRFRAELFPPPDDSVPGPEGIRRLQFQVSTASDRDFVGVVNRTGRDFFDVSFGSELGRGDDLFEGAGQVSLAARPGQGFDVARVTRNLLPFVSEFERVEILGGAP